MERIEKLENTVVELVVTIKELTSVVASRHDNAKGKYFEERESNFPLTFSQRVKSSLTSIGTVDEFKKVRNNSDSHNTRAQIILNLSDGESFSQKDSKRISKVCYLN